MTDVVMPQMGESIVEGTLTKWLKKAGEHVDRDEPLFEISTDKVDTEIPSPAAGVLKEVLVEEGKTVAISTVVGRIEEGAGNGASAPAPAAAKAVPAPPAPACFATDSCAARGAMLQSPPHARTCVTFGWPLSDSGGRARARRGSRIARRSPVASGSQDGARVRHRSAPGDEAAAPEDASPSRIWKLICRRKEPGPWPNRLKPARQRLQPPLRFTRQQFPARRRSLLMPRAEAPAPAWNR